MDTTLIHLIPQPWRDYIVIAAVVSPILGRIFYALTNGTGLVGAIRAVFFGTNTPK